MSGNEELRALLAEVSANFTRDDDLPNGLLQRIDAALAPASGGEGREAVRTMYAPADKIAEAFARPSVRVGAVMAYTHRDEAMRRTEPVQIIGTAAPPTPTPQAAGVSEGEVLVTVSGLTGSGKSGVAGEIEILCKALGLEVQWVNGDEEKRLTHADWTEALELYKPRVRIVEQNVPSTTPALTAAGSAPEEEACEGAQPDCGPVVQHDSEGVPLCQRCWDGLLADSAQENPHA